MKRILLLFLSLALPLYAGNVTNLPFTTSLTATDYFYMVHYSNGVEVSRNVTVPDLASNALPWVLPSVTNAIASSPNPLVVIAATHSHAGLQDNGAFTPYYGMVNGTNRTYRTKHYATCNATGLRCDFGNFANEYVGTNNISVRASLESSNGTIYPLYFNGGRTVVIEPSGYARSDISGFSVAKGEQFWSRVNVQAGTTGFWYTALGMLSTGEGWTNADSTTSGTIPTTVDFSYSPMAIYGQSFIPVPVIAGFGDSILMSQGDADDRNNSFFVKALGTNYGQSFSHIVLGQGGELMITATFTNRLRFLPGVTHAVCEYGINDIINANSAASLEAAYVIFWNKLAANHIRIYQTTITPKTTSTDGWVTTGNQTTNAYNAVRVAVNAWIRTKPAPLSGYFEVADLVETARDSGIWKANYTGDGIHPLGPTHTIMATAIDTNQFNIVTW